MQTDTAAVRSASPPTSAGGHRAPRNAHYVTRERGAGLTIMPLLDRISQVVPPSSRRPSRPVAAAAGGLTALAVVVGVWVSGALLTDDAILAKGATAGWLGLAGVLAMLSALRWRTLALPVVAAYTLATVSIGGFLLWTSTVDHVVVEDVVVAAEPVESSPAAGPGKPSGTRTGPQLVARGAFRSGEHGTTGTAALLRRADGAAVVTLTDLDTSPGPDLRVYLVPGSGAEIRSALDLGALRGNRGTQQYDIPGGTNLARFGSVVIWCRAFSVAFGTATLAPA